jgi:hypothetical protein
MTTDTNWSLRHRQALVRWLDENTSMDSRECIHVAGGILNRLDEFSALTAERAKVAALEAEVERLNKALTCATVPMLTLTRSDLEIELAHFRAESTRWRDAKPVAWAYVNPDGECEQIEWGPVFDDPHVIPLYALPPSPETT